MYIGRENPRENEGTNGVASPRGCPTWQMKVILTVLWSLVLHFSASLNVFIICSPSFSTMFYIESTTI